MKKILVVIILIVVIGWPTFTLVNRSLIEMSLETDLKPVGIVHQSLLDEQAKREMLLLYSETNNQLYDFARTSKMYRTYDRQKTQALLKYDQTLAQILDDYKARKNAKLR